MDVILSPRSWTTVVFLILLVLFTSSESGSREGRGNDPNDFIETLSLPDSGQDNGNSTQAIYEQLLNEIDSLTILDKGAALNKLQTLITQLEENPQPDAILLGNLYHRKGKLLDSGAQFSKAIEAFEESVAYKKSTSEPDSSLIVLSYNFIGIEYMRLKNHSLSLLYLDTAMMWTTDEESTLRDKFDIFLNKGVNYAYLGSYDQSYTFFHEAHEILENTDAIQDSTTIAIFYNNYGLWSTIMGKIDEANDLLEHSEAIFVKLLGENHEAIARINSNKGINAYNNYDFEKARIFLSKALNIFMSHPEKTADIAITYYNLGSVAMRTDDYGQMLDYSRKGLAYARDNDMKLLLTLNMARAYQNLRSGQQADSVYRKAIELLDRKDVSKTRSVLIYENYADFLSSSAPEEAFHYLGLALQSTKEIYGEADDNNAPILTSMGDLYIQQSQPLDALDAYTKALQIWTGDSSNSQTNLDRTQHATTLMGIARASAMIAQDSHDTSWLYKGEKAYTRVLEAMQSLSQSLSNDNKIVLAGLLKPGYQQAIDVEYQLYALTGDQIHLKRAFTFAESAKSSSLLAAVNNQYALKTADLPEEVFVLEKEISSNITTLQRLLSDELSKKTPDNRKAAFYQSRILELMGRYDSLVLQMEAKYPLYYTLKYNSNTISAASIQDHLQDDECFIEYEMSDSALYRIIITEDEVSFTKQAITAKDREALNRIISLKSTLLHNENLSRFKAFVDDSRQLYKLLLGDANLENNQKRITIVPDGLLGYLPFEVLTSHDVATDSINYRDLPFVVYQHAVSYTPSGSLKYNPFFQPLQHKTERTLLAMAPSYNKTLPYSDHYLPNLPWARQEATAIAHFMHGDALVDSMATKANFIQRSDSYGLIHLAMHTLINDSLPLNSKLVFYKSQGDSASPYLTTAEIYGMQFKAQQVILSACNTGTGRFRRGEGIMSLARGFLFAGVPSMVMTLWEVQDENGARLMEAYYDFLDKGEPKDIALQQAKISVLRSANMAKSHPYFWSPYLLSGNTDTLIKSSRFHWWMILPLLLLAGIMFKFKHRNKQRGS